VPTPNRPPGLVDCVGVALPFTSNRTARDGLSSRLLPTAWSVACKGHRPRTPRTPNSTDADVYPGLSAGQHGWIASLTERLMSDDARLGRVIRACHESRLARKIKIHTLDQSHQYTHFDYLPIFSTSNPIKMTCSSRSLARSLPLSQQTSPAISNPPTGVPPGPPTHQPTQRHHHIPSHPVPSDPRSHRRATVPSRSRTSPDLGNRLPRDTH
jgi:hypothetical protein